jgi:hypothetical protein
MCHLTRGFPEHLIAGKIEELSRVGLSATTAQRSDIRDRPPQCAVGRRAMADWVNGGYPRQLLGS